MNKSRNIDRRQIWGNDSLPNLSDVFRSCMGYSATPGWAFIQRSAKDIFSRFEGLRAIELGCGEGKVSLLLSLLGVKTTLVDYSPKQLRRAKHIAEKFGVQTVIIEEDVLNLPSSFWERYDISMSFGTAEHFFGRSRQSIFNVHSKVLRKGGLSVIWVPNRYGIVFHFGVMLRRLFRRQVCSIDEIPFTRKELFQCGMESGLNDIKIVGGESLINDFNNHVLNVRRLLRSPVSDKAFTGAQQAKHELLQCMARNNAPIRPWNNLFSYPLILIGRKSGL